MGEAGTRLICAFVLIPVTAGGVFLGNAAKSAKTTALAVGDEQSSHRNTLHVLDAAT
jgi:hypothetical protein